MSKIAEQKANEVFPLPPLYNEEQRKSLGYAQVYTRVKDQQEGFIKGYDQAMQDFLEKAEGAISMISRHYVGEDYTFDQIWEEFKQNYKQFK